MQTYYSNTKTLINYSQTPLIWALVGKGGGGGRVARVKGSVRTRRVEFRENARAFFHQGQRHRSLIIPVLSGF